VERLINSANRFNILDYPIANQNKKWRGRYGIAQKDIQEAEQTLGVLLPDSYRRFLQYSNGGETIDVPNSVSIFSLNDVLEFALHDARYQNYLPGMLVFAGDFGDYIFYFDVHGSLDRGHWAIFGGELGSLSLNNSHYIESDFNSFIKRVFEGPPFNLWG
jgi:SMI1 / KNR4 family (SUKH-1)